ncbi:GntR family transcriptional regulator [Vagococcus sp.]|uniref:GntR family transcriptional regulator n=1 Tax=Vagococcus sp. TaxID=1933889 RepID=UPI003F9936BA
MIKDDIYQFISEQIIRGNYQKEERLIEQNIAEHLNISRTPVREAMFLLTADDILEHEPRRGFKLKQFTERDMEEIYEVIGVLDGKIAQLTINQLQAEDYATMNFLIEAMNAAIDNSLYIKYNELQFEFHEVYIKKCSNQKLVEDIEKKKKLFIGKGYPMERVDIKQILYQTNEEHRKILALFEAKKSAELRNFIEEVHWRTDNACYDVW